MYLSFIIIIVIFQNAKAGSRCPNFGKLNYTCYASDYCDITLNLSCGDGTCGHSCPSGWSEVNKTCYFISNISKTFSQAETFCKSYQANLATIKTNEKLDIIKQLLDVYSVGLYNGFWVSAEAISLFLYQWADGTLLNQTNPLWYPTQPDNYNGVENCVQLLNLLNYNDAYCDDLLPFICELEIETCNKTRCKCKPGYYLDGSNCVPYKSYNKSCLFDSECNQDSGLNCIKNSCQCLNNTKWYETNSKCQKCPSGWININSSCYTLTRMLFTYDEAQKFCRTFDASLLTLTDKNEFNQIISLVDAYLYPSSSIWVNTIVLESDVCFDLADNQVFPTQKMWCTNTASIYRLENCPYMTSYSNGNCVSYQNCTAKLYPLCEAPEYIGAFNKK